MPAEKYGFLCIHLFILCVYVLFFLYTHKEKIVLESQTEIAHGLNPQVNDAIIEYKNKYEMTV